MILGSRVRIHLELILNVHFEYVFLDLAKKILSLEWLSIMFFGGMESRLKAKVHCLYFCQILGNKRHVIHDFKGNLLEILI